MWARAKLCACLEVVNACAANGQFVEKDGQAYCENHYYELFGGRCMKCNQPIQGDHLSALGGKWHTQCFVCTECNAPFPGG